MNGYEVRANIISSDQRPAAPVSTAEQLRVALAAEKGRMGLSPIVPAFHAGNASSRDLVRAMRTVASAEDRTTLHYEK